MFFPESEESESPGGDGQGDVDQVHFLADNLSMSSRTRSQKVNKNGGKGSAEWASSCYQACSGKSNILLLNDNLKSGKALKGCVSYST